MFNFILNQCVNYKIIGIIFIFYHKILHFVFPVRTTFSAILWDRMFQFISLLCKLQALNKGNESYKILKNFMTLSNLRKSIHFMALDALIMIAPNNNNNDYLAYC